MAGKIDKRSLQKMKRACGASKKQGVGKISGYDRYHTSVAASLGAELSLGAKKKDCLDAWEYPFIVRRVFL